MAMGRPNSCYNAGLCIDGKYTQSWGGGGGAKVGCTVLTTCFRDLGGGGGGSGWIQTTTFKNEKLEIEDVRAVLEMYKEDIKQLALQY